ncbi:MAG TPA: hypothetical protein VFT39_09055 [Vicinamibacterales bacterium]|nr:hypothetical protein [Vicinamibacterales bacterium]
MLVLALGLGLTAVLLSSLARRPGSLADLGTMSDQWVAAYTSRPSSSEV